MCPNSFAHLLSDDLPISAFLVTFRTEHRQVFRDKGAALILDLIVHHIGTVRADETAHAVTSVNPVNA